MVFENKKSIGKAKLFRFVFLLICGSALIMVLVSDFFHFKPLGLDRGLYMLFLGFLYIGVSAYRYYRNYWYICFSDENNEIMIKYYHSILFGRKYGMVRIPFGELAKYEIEKSFLRKNLVLYQRTSGGKISRYKPISITAVPKENLELILASLEMHK
jgi:hypothetical protein